MRVSVCVVALDEESHLPQLLMDILSQSYPQSKTEVILVDSGSKDKTKSIMEDFRASEAGFYSIKVLDNPKRIQAAGWNVAIANSTGEVIIRLDAHTKIPPSFVEKNVANLEKGEYVSGGVRPCLIMNETPWKRALLQAENSMFGSGISIHRRGNKKSYVKTLFHGAYKREVFRKVGGFNEKLLRTEDNEIHYRIGKAGYKLLFDPEVVSYQYARSSLRQMIKQKYGNGYWVGLTLSVCPGCLSIYHFVPFAFIMGIIITTIIGLLGITWPAAVMWLCYWSLAIVLALASTVGNKFNIYFLLLPVLFFILHISYGIGTLVGVVKIPYLYRKLRQCSEAESIKEKLTVG